MGFASFLLANLTIVFVILLSLWQATIIRLFTDIPFFSNIFVMVSSKFFILMFWGMPWISIHSPLEYCSSLYWRRSMLINCSFNFFVFYFRRLDVFSATANLLLITLFSFRRSRRFFDKSPSLLLIVLFCCGSSVWFPNISSCSSKKLCTNCSLSIFF